MLSCARASVSRALFRPPVAYRSLAAVSSGNVDTSGIPVVDFANFGSLSFEQRRETARQVVDGFKNMGFVYLGNHGISDKVVQEAFKRVRGLFPWKIFCSTGYAQSDEFFHLPLEKKVSTRLSPVTQVLLLKRAYVLAHF